MAENHTFNKAFAKKYGIEEAIIFNNLYHWCLHNKKNDANKYQDKNGIERYWTYNTCKAFAEIFDYMSPAKIRRTLISLEEKGLIISDNFNKSAYDRTKWYAITNLGEDEYFESLKDRSDALYEESILQKCKMEITESENQIDGSVKPIPYINTDIKPDVNTNTTYASELDDLRKQLEEQKAIIEDQKKVINEQKFFLTKDTSSEIKASSGFSKKDYKDCVSILEHNRAELINSGKTIDTTQYPIPIMNKWLKSKFTLFGVEDTKKGLQNSVKHDWLVNETHYSFTALFKDEIFAQCVSGFNLTTNGKKNTKDSAYAQFVSVQTPDYTKEIKF